MSILPRDRPARRRRADLLVLTAIVAILCPSPCHAYIGPGAGFAVLGSLAIALAAMALGAVILLTWPTRLLFYRWRVRRRAAGQVARVVILGFDGMDPGVVEELMAAGRLPHLAQLRDSGAYARLGTTCPPMSPVAWSSFATGTGPGRHSIFDFLHRDPRTYLPNLSSAQVRPARRALRLGKLWMPMGRPSVRLLRRSKAFWSVLGDHGVFSTVLRVPITFPPDRFRGLMLSGMCVPDLRGTQGSFTLFTTADNAPSNQVGGQWSRLIVNNGVARGALTGPPGFGRRRATEVPFRLRPASDREAVMEIEGQQVSLRVGEYSDWIPIVFRLGPPLLSPGGLGLRQQASGICRCYLKQLDPQVELYVSPINIDPERPALPVSHPVTYSIYLAKRLGRYATLGLAEDTWALNQGVLDEGAFLGQCELLFAERERMLFNALSNSRTGCVVCVFDTTDRVQHMFWRDRQAEPARGKQGRTEVPARPGRDVSSSRLAIQQSYEQADALVGKVRLQLGERDVLMIVSDHGFKPFKRGVNLNTWLLQHGYLALRPGATGESEWLRDVAWESTRAYAIGLVGIYLNLKGREAMGFVSEAEAMALKQELINRLTSLQDEMTGEAAIARVLDNATVNPGPYVSSGPDLVVCYNPGYRTSWDAAQGKVAGPVIEGNARPWSGDHCVDPESVPGVLFCSHRLTASRANIIDIAPTVLDFFGISAPSYMQGRSLLSPPAELSLG